MGKLRDEAARRVFALLAGRLLGSGERGVLMPHKETRKNGAKDDTVLAKSLKIPGGNW